MDIVYKDDLFEASAAQGLSGGCGFLHDHLPLKRGMFVTMIRSEQSQPETESGKASQV